MKKKSNRAALITVVVIAAIAICYVGYFMRPQPLMDCMPGTQPPVAGRVVQHTQDNPEGTDLELTEGEQLDGLWQIMQDTQIRFLRGRGAAIGTEGGAYYEILLTGPDGSTDYGFGYSTDGTMLIQGSDYKVLEENKLGPALEALFVPAAE